MANAALREIIKADFARAITKRTGVEHVFEYRFAADAGRKWRSDIAFPSVKVAIEIDGGLWTYGRHNRASSVLADMEKGNAYVSRGWLVWHTPWEWIERGKKDRSAELLEEISAAITARVNEGVKNSGTTDFV